VAATNVLSWWNGYHVALRRL